MCHCLQDGGQLYVSVAMTPSSEEPNFRPKNVGRGRPCIVLLSRRNLLPSCPPTTSSWGQLRIWVINCYAVHFTFWYKSLHLIQVRGHLHLAATMARQDPDSYEVFWGGKRVFRV